MNIPPPRDALDAAVTEPLAPSLEKRRLRLAVFLMLLDALLIFGCFLLVGEIYSLDVISHYGDDELYEMTVRQSILIVPMFFLLGVQGGLYRPVKALSMRRATSKILATFALAATIVLFFTFYAKTTATFSRAIFTLGSVSSVVAMIAARDIIKSLYQRHLGTTLVNTLVISEGRKPIRLRNAFHVDAHEHRISPDMNDPENLDRLGRYVTNMDRVIVCCPDEDREPWTQVLRYAGVQGEFVSEALQSLGAFQLNREDGFTTITVSVRPLSLWARTSKRVVDVVITSIALLVLSPLMLVVAAMIRLEDGGPVLFRQRRMGYGNTFFDILKFRSMRHESSDHHGARSTGRSDDRITRIGRFIRKTSIDELPQLVNVWRGDMSLVGPRPHALGSIAGEKLFWEIDGRYWHRHALKPGITGLAQVRGFRGATENERDLSDRLQSDLEYIARWTLMLDFKIMLKTALVLVHKNAY